MKKLTYSLTLIFLLTRLLAVAQTAVPTVPDQVTFADMVIRLDPDARRIVQQDVNALISSKQYWTAKLDRVALYFPMIEAILIDEDVPTDFKYLAVQESSLTPDAVSSSMAVGYWQFKQETANNYGLRVDDDVDERKNITASTHAAGKYLKKGNTQFNNWVAALYSYYLGAGGIAKLVPPDWAYAREIALDGRTDRYILRFFAHKIAIENALTTHQNSNRFALIEYPNGGGKTMRAIAAELGVDEIELRKYNRWLTGETVPTDKMYVMAVPVMGNQINDIRQKIVNVGSRKTPEFVQNDVGFPVLRRVTTGLSNRNDPVLYEINGLPGIQAQAGDNAASLSRKAKISLSSFLRYNDMSDRDPVIVNDVYYLAKKRKKALVPFHNVRENETARSISQRYGIRLKKLMRYNRLDRVQKLATGRVMWLRERRPASKPIEIIKSPTPPVYDQTPTPPPTRQADLASATNPAGTTRPVSGLNDVPRNPSERKRYQPKLIDGGVTPNDGTSEPATAPRPVGTTTAPPATTSRSVSTSDGTQRVVIVRTPDATEPAKSVPVATTPERTASTDRPATPPKSVPTAEVATDTKSASGASISDEDLAPTAPKPVKKAPTTGTGRPTRAAGSDGYDGPREQQADGSLTVPEPTSSARPAKPAVVKTETRPAPVETAPIVKTTPAPAPATTPPPTAAPRTATAGSKGAATHTVEPGQTYYSISRQYGLTVDELLALNSLTAASPLEVGQQLTVKATPKATADVKTAPARPATAARAETATSSGEVVYHTVAKGETMFRLTKIYGVTIDQIKEWNNLSDVVVRVGQKIKIIK